jgi:signal transduction histidine kinase
VHNDIPLAVEEMNCRPAPWRVSQAYRTDVGVPPWELYYAVVYLACVAIVEAGPLSLAGRIEASAGLAGMLPWYLLVGRPHMLLADKDWQEAQRSWRGSAYLTGLVLLFAVVQSQNTEAWFLSFALSPQCFQVTTVRRSMVFVTVLNGVAGLLLIVSGHGLENAVIALGYFVFAVGFSYVFSRFGILIMEQNAQNAALIEALSSARSELNAAHHEAGVLAERHRLAGEIHDTLAQGFTSIVTLVQAAEAGLGPEVGEVRRHLDMALVAARENLAEARALVTVLSPARLDSTTLGDALRRVTETTAAEAGIAASAQVEGKIRPLPTGTEVVLLRVCQEALANVRKHAGARDVRVCLSYADAGVRLTVADDGRGFDTSAATAGYGLRGMRERVRQVGGVVEIRTAEGSGTEVCAEVPG